MAINKVYQFFDYQAQQYPQEKCFGTKVNNDWQFLSTHEVIQQAKQLATGLHAAGYQRGDKIALISYKNQPEWVIADLAMQYAGIISVPLYPTISPGEYEYIMDEAECKAAFIGKGDLEKKVNDVRAALPRLRQLIGLDENVGDLYWKNIIQAVDQHYLDQSIAQIKSSDLFTIIYTSGTTGKPKGVMLSHLNLSSCIEMVVEHLPVVAGDKVLSFLPMCHIFERAASYAFVQRGLSIYLTGTDNLGGESGDLKTVAPHFFTCVPRLLEKVYEKIYNKGADLTGVKKKLFFWALDLTDHYEYDQKLNFIDGIKWALADKLIFSKWRAALGGQVKGILTGSAPCPVKILKVFSAAGIPVREAYGLTEASPGISINKYIPHQAIIGTVGPLLTGVDVMIDNSENIYKEGEGEILAAGDNIMMGYYKQPQWTADTLQEINGKTWLRTGDIGTFVIDKKGTRFLKITDRKKELFKTSGGKYVAPAPIESKFKEEFLIDNIMLIGDGMKFISALIVPTEEPLKNWCEENGVAWSALKDMIKKPEVINLYQSLVDKINPLFGHIEQIKKFVLISDIWAPINEDGTAGDLTPTLKLKRRSLKSKYKDLIDAIYAE